MKNCITCAFCVGIDKQNRPTCKKQTCKYGQSVPMITKSQIIEDCDDYIAKNGKAEHSTAEWRQTWLLK